MQRNLGVALVLVAWSAGGVGCGGAASEDADSATGGNGAVSGGNGATSGGKPAACLRFYLSCPGG